MSPAEKPADTTSGITYQVVSVPDEAEFSIRRVPVTLARSVEPKSDEQIRSEVEAQVNEQSWQTSEYWRNKGMPQEQIEFTVNGQIVTVYNYNKDARFTDEHQRLTAQTLQRYAIKFPQILEKLKYVLIDDIQEESLFGNDDYPLNGEAYAKWGAIKVTPRGMGLHPHRVTGANNYEGTLIHEWTHLIQDDFIPEWSAKYLYDFCADHEDDWEVKTTPNGKMNRFFNRHNGKMSLQGQFALQPDECVSDYSRYGNVKEDICDCMVAYQANPQLIYDTSESKFAMFNQRDQKDEIPTTSYVRKPPEGIALPAAPSRTVKYFIKE